MKTPTLPTQPTMPDVIAALREVGERLPPDDGFRHFNAMYLLVTEGVAARVNAGEAHDPEFLVQLDAVFCQLYFDALGADDPDAAPRAWRPMLERRQKQGISALRYAIAGMNAHINRDLLVALDHAHRRMGGELVEDEPRHKDFCAVDELLHALMPRTKDMVQDPVEDFVDDSLGVVDDVLEHWSIRSARKVAWENAQQMIRLRDHPTMQAMFLRSIDRTTGVIGRLLLL